MPIVSLVATALLSALIATQVLLLGYLLFLSATALLARVLTRANGMEVISMIVFRLCDREERGHHGVDGGDQSRGPLKRLLLANEVDGFFIQTHAAQGGALGG